MQLTFDDFQYLALCLEGFFFGLYSGIFVLHLRYHLSKKGMKQNLIFYALCVLYVLSLAVIALDIASTVVGVLKDETSTIAYRLDIAQTPVFALCDFIAQSILIHRCWIVWGYNTHVVIIPSILAFAYLVMWIAGTGAFFIEQGEIEEAGWGNTLAFTSLTASMAVNALVTGLIVFRIFKVFREVKATTTSDEKSLGVTRGRNLRSIIFVITESGMALFAIQLARVSIAPFKVWTDAENDVYILVASIHEMLNGITPTIILVRVSMGLSFHDEISLVESIGSLEFAADNPNAISGAGSHVSEESLHDGHDDPNSIPEMVINNEERRDDEGGEIQMVDRENTAAYTSNEIL